MPEAKGKISAIQLDSLLLQLAHSKILYKMNARSGGC